jgi:hypothetical protein
MKDVEAFPGRAGSFDIGNRRDADPDIPRQGDRTEPAM